MKSLVSFILMILGFAMPMWGWVTMQLARPDMGVIWFALYIVNIYFVSIGTAEWSKK